MTLWPLRFGWLLVRSLYKEKKKLDPTQSYDESPYANREFNNQLTTQIRHQKQLLRTSWSTNSHPTGVVKPVNGTVPNLPTNRKSRVIKMTYM